MQLELRTVAGRDALRQALLAMVPQIDELQRKREQMKRVVCSTPLLSHPLCSQDVLHTHD